MTYPLLLATVGGAPEPIVASLRKWQPARAIFIVSPESYRQVAEKIVPQLQTAGWSDFDAGRYDLHEVPDAENFTDIVNQLRPLDDRVVSWQRDHPDARIIADFTGGTKAMSAALALVAARWPCHFSYVGGFERTKDGMGVVVPGREHIVQSLNPADTLALLTLDIVRALLHRHAFAAAGAVLQDALHRVTDLARKAELGVVLLLGQALADWDRFQFQAALNKLCDLPKHAHNLEAALGHATAQTLLAQCARLRAHLEAILKDKAAGSSPPVSRALVLDLLANARRRLDEHRWDDAVARLYRAIEATAQLHLNAHGIPDTDRVPLNQVPEPLRSEWAPRNENGHLKLGLQDAWRLLQALNAAAAAVFFNSGLNDREKSPLTARNQSILAHGFAPVAEKTARDLLKTALQLLGATEADLPRNPFSTATRAAAAP